MTQPEGQTARDIFPEDEGLPEVAQDDSPTMERAEDPEFAPLPGEQPGASADFGTTSLEQAEGESLDGRLAREIPDDAPDVRPAEDPQRAFAQLEQDLDTPSAGKAPRRAPSTSPTADSPPAGPTPGVRHARGGLACACTVVYVDERGSADQPRRCGVLPECRHPFDHPRNRGRQSSIRAAVD